MIKKIFLTLLLLAISLPVLAVNTGSFFFMGDGKLNITRGKNAFTKVTFRNADGAYALEGLRTINKLYGSSWADPENRMSLRLIELLDFLEDHFGGKGIRIISGYRSPSHNENLRNNGKLAATSSLHMDAEALDIVMEGVPSSTINEYLIAQDCCGVGFYHGRAIHIDTGPPRFWDEVTSGTEKKEPPENEHITIKTASDIYKNGEKIELMFSRVTNYPIGVKGRMELICNMNGHTKKSSLTAEFLPTADEGPQGCYILKDRKEGRNIFIKQLDASSGIDQRCQIRAFFCEPKTSKMPEYVDSNRMVINN